MLTVGCMKTLGFAQTHSGASFGEVPSDCRPKAFTPKQQAGGEYIFKQEQPFALKAEKASRRRGFSLPYGYGGWLGDAVLAGYYGKGDHNGQYPFDEIKSRHPETYDFLMSVKDRLSTMKHDQ